MKNAAKKSAPKKRRSNQVPGQFYGYSLQITRVVAHFLRARQGQSVSIEHLDDVATHTDEGVIAEQDKSGLAHNPVADRSPELWKSLANWVRSIRDGALKSDTRFLFYVAQGHHGDVIDCIHAVKNKADADAVVLSLRSKFWGNPPKYAAKANLPKGLAEHVNEVLSASSEVLALLFTNLSLENGSGAPNDDLTALPGMAAISQEKKDEVLTLLLGWAKKVIDKRIEGGRAAVITWDEFHRQFVSAAKKLDRAENVLAANPVEVTEAELQKELRDRTYVRQLEVVRCDDGEMVQAVNDYLRSVAHRTNWSEDGDVIESSFGEFEDSIDRAWKSQKAVVDIEQKSLAEEERGRLLYAKCQLLKVPLQGMDVPGFFVPGSFHTLANSLRVGWHPRYRETVAALVPDLPENEQEVTGVAPAADPVRKRRHSTAPPSAVAGGELVDKGGGE
ncbi:hypothetical protein OV208_27035 [Corallococcus sp. bb12-1]|uniref:ABC-three component system protein n=1 Tax=Corallococcus sp. bb12-1 TaxID=2996784 RepID=UPI00226E2713|nr:ABC-three component system protein [Corallococcus sp. bb12-1]MCY1044999.1 hypothetical protein [Corallococcus sp. bb12-1]